MTKNKHYRKFLDEGDIKLLTPDHFRQLVNNVSGIFGKHKREGKVLVSLLYYTGARPAEILKLRQGDVWRSKDYRKAKIDDNIDETEQKSVNYVIVKLPATKQGKTRNFYIREDNYYVPEIFDWCFHNFPGILLFPHYISRYTREYVDKQGNTKKYVEITDKLRYHIKKWSQGVFKGGIVPYYLRHNRFSKLISNDISAAEIQLLKGAKTMASVQPYLHLSSKTFKKVADIND